MAFKKRSNQWQLMVAAAGVSAVLGVLTTLLAIGYLRQRELRQTAHEESALARSAAAEAREAANRGNRARDEAEALVGFLLEDLSEELDLIGRTDLLAAAAQKTVDYFDNLPPGLVTRESRDKQATVLLTLGQGHYVQGDLDAAYAAMSRAIALRRELAGGEDPEGEFQFVLGREIEELALVQNAREDYAGGRRSYLEALRLFSEPPPSAIRDGHWEYGVATAHFGLGEVERLQGNYEEALNAYTNANIHLELALQKQPDKVGWLKKRMNLQNNSGVIHMYLGNLKHAEAIYLSGVEAARELIRLEPANRRWEKELGTALLNIGTCLDEQQQYERAEPFIREGVQIRRGLVSWDPKNARNVRSLAHAWHNLSSLQFSTQQATNALASCREAMSAYRRLLLLDPENERWIEDMQLAAIKYRDRLASAGLKREALKLIQEATAFAEDVRAGNPRGDAWDDLLAGFYDDIRALGGDVPSASLLVSARKSLVARAAKIDLNPEDTEAVYGWALACARWGESHHEAGLSSAGLDCLRVGRWALHDLVPEGYEYRELFLDDIDRSILTVALACGQTIPPRVLVSAGASWRYWDHAAIPGTNWAQPDFEDESWKTGRAPIGYGEADLVSVIDYGEHPGHKNMTVWFRHEFMVDDPSQIKHVRISMRRDDGAIVYLNGREIIRDYLPPGDVRVETAADMTADEEESIYHITSFPGEALPLILGRNVVAVEVHQNEPQSSDLALDLEIVANIEELDLKRIPTAAVMEKLLSDALPQHFKNHMTGKTGAALR